MTKDEALKLALEALERCVATCFDPYAHEQAISWSEHFVNQTITAIKETLTQPEPVKIAHMHEWFRTGEMKVGQMRCISCGTWAEEEMPQRTWVGLTLEEILETYRGPDGSDYVDYARGIEAKLKEKNT